MVIDKEQNLVYMSSDIPHICYLTLLNACVPIIPSYLIKPIDRSQSWAATVDRVNGNQESSHI